jgi:predicted RNase H-like HicB family nuclease
MVKYLVVIERSEKNYSAFCPDVPGCIAAGRTVKETIAQITMAIRFHLAWLLQSEEQLPRPKGIMQHIDEGLFGKGLTAKEFYSIEVEVSIPEKRLLES